MNFKFSLIFCVADENGVVAQNTDSLNTAGAPIVLQRRGSVYGANVPMITGNNCYFTFETIFLCYFSSIVTHSNFSLLYFATC